MTQLINHRKKAQFNLKRRIECGVLILQRCICCFWDRIFVCSLGKPVRYRLLPHSTVPSPSPSILETGNLAPASTTRPSLSLDPDNLVALKISLLGDCHTGKTSFLEKYIGDEKQQGASPGEGINLMDKTLVVRGARISYSIWEVAGGSKSKGNIPVACKDSIAIIFMFDLTSRCTLKSVIKWYQQARKYNQTAIPIIVGTKFDEFIQLPIDLQWTIASQARAYAKALNATLFFSSATYNINVNKIFKFITAKIFDIPWTLEKNLKIGEPIIDF